MKFADLIARLNHKVKTIPTSSTSTYKKRAYQNVISSIKDNHKMVEVATTPKINKLPITDHMKTKLKWYLSHPDVGLKNKEKETLKTKLKKIKGIGDTLAKKLVDRGVKKESDLKKNLTILPDSVRKHLYYKPQRIAHEDIKKLEPMFKKVSPRLVITGSYRRKAKFSNDIDIVYPALQMGNLLEKIKRVFKTINVIVYANGPDKISFVLVHKPNNVKVDIFRCDPDEKVPMILYSTGSKQNNIVMRATAKRKGYVLNQKGLFKDGKKIPLKTEKDYFKILDLPYLPPDKR